MALDPSHLNYPHLKYGMDHSRYEWSMLSQRPPVVWPGGKRLAVCVNVSVQHFPMNPLSKSVKLPGSMTMPYPDLRHFSLRDYGNRVGIYRFFQALDRYRVRASFAVNAVVAERYPYLMDAIAERGTEVLAHSWSMDTPQTGGLEPDAEAKVIERSLAALQKHVHQPIRGWLGPGKLQSASTPELLKSAGFSYFCDWVNDEMPFEFATDNGPIWSFPLSTEIEDRFVVMDNLHSEASWAEQVIDAFEFLLNEARSGHPRLLTLSLHPWVMGQPHRVKHLERVLERLSSIEDVWHATPGQIVDVVKQQMGATKA